MFNKHRRAPYKVGLAIWLELKKHRIKQKDLKEVSGCSSDVLKMLYRHQRITVYSAGRVAIALAAIKIERGLLADTGSKTP